VGCRVPDFDWQHYQEPRCITAISRRDGLRPYKETRMSDTTSLLEQASNSGAFDNLAPPIQIAIFLGAMAFLTTALVTVTAFSRIVIVLSFVRRALSTQEIPPTPVIIGLAFFMTFFVMGSTFDSIATTAVRPYLAKEIGGTQAIQRSADSLAEFMLRQTRKQDIALFLKMAKVPHPETAADTPLRVLIPAFIISELKTAFIMGFCIYIPFLLVDLVVSTVLMAMGMMMMPPVIISTPLKILLFVLVDGWHLVIQSLTASFR
jgi:flagellar biosynthesis protein FliP